MPSVHFVQTKPRAFKKVGPLLEKKGFCCSEGPPDPEDLQRRLIGPNRPDCVIVDMEAQSMDHARGVIEKYPDYRDRVLAVVPPGQESPAPQGTRTCAPGGIVDAVLELHGAADKPPESSPEAIVALKTGQVRALRGRGVEPYPHRFLKKDAVDAINRLGGALEKEQRSGREVTTAGRVMQLRLQGKAAFLDLQDGSGKAQVYARVDALGEQAFGLLKEFVHIGDFVGVSGEVFKTRTGQPTLEARSLVLLAKALRPLPEKWHGLKDVDARYRQRHLDLVANREVRELFEKRSRIVDSVRATFRELGYLEVETPILLPQAGGASATPFKTHHNALKSDLVLRIATELYLKRLVIGGFERVFELGRIFRNEGIDTRHNPEFTMLEAYAAYADYNDMAGLLERVIGNAAKALGIESVDYEGRAVRLTPPFQRLRLPELWKQGCGADIHEILDGKAFCRPALLALARKLKVDASEATSSAKLFERILDARVLPLLKEPAFVLDHPTAVTPLAKCKPGDESLVERFEFFAGGEELANAYTELNDPLDQRERLAEQMRQRKGGDAEADILDEDFVRAMECGMPPTGGIGIGIDRLCMLLTGRPSIRELILFPTLKPESA